MSKTLTPEQKARKAEKERERYAAKKAAKQQASPKKHEVGSHVTFITARGNSVTGAIKRLILHKKSGKTYVEVLQGGKAYVKQLEKL